MIYKLKRKEYRDDGIFSELYNENDQLIAHTLEHSYNYNKPKLYAGTFKCVRGMHQLHGMDHPFETFEITGVNGHTGILFHAGNWNADSDGCVLLGENVTLSPQGQMVTASRLTFGSFMSRLKGINEFELAVE